MNKKQMEKTIVVDIDGIVTNEIEGHDYENRTGNVQNIRTLEDYKRRGYTIVLLSARHREDLKITKKWLENHEVPYDELVLGKPKGVEYIDDLGNRQLDREVLLCSGGLDSLIAYSYLNEPKAVYFDLETQYSWKEKIAIEKLNLLGLNIEIKQAMALGDFEEGMNAYISKRNLLLTTMASYYGNRIYLVGILGDNVEDKSPLAFKSMSNAMNFIQKDYELEVKVDSPFWNMTKGEIVKWYLNNEDNAVEKLKASVSCYDAETTGQCGRCPACFRKWIALHFNDMKLIEFLFDKDPRTWNGIPIYVAKAKAGEYHPRRTAEMQTVLEQQHLWKSD